MEIKDSKARELCYFLIHFVKIKFYYELTSSVYQVAAILRVSTLKNWIARSYATGYLKKCLEAIKDVGI